MNEFHVLVCVNDDNGRFTWQCDTVTVQLKGGFETLLHLSGPPLKFKCVGGNRHNWQLGSFVMRVFGYMTWCGNIYWDGFTVLEETAVSLLNFLRERGWTCEEGLEQLIGVSISARPLDNPQLFCYNSIIKSSQRERPQRKTKMAAVSKIRKALNSIMSEGEANACRIDNSYQYDGSQQRRGWHFTRFGSTPTFLGSNVNEALETIEQIKEERESYR